VRRRGVGTRPNKKKSILLSLGAGFLTLKKEESASGIRQYQEKRGKAEGNCHLHREEIKDIMKSYLQSNAAWKDSRRGIGGTLEQMGEEKRGGMRPRKNGFNSLHMPNWAADQHQGISAWGRQWEEKNPNALLQQQTGQENCVRKICPK